MESSSDHIADEAVRKDRAEGACLGAFIADSIGSAVEFKLKVSKEECDEAMKMPGLLGRYRVAPG